MRPACQAARRSVSRNASSLDQPRTRAGQEQTARGHRLQGQAVHVEVAFQGVIDLLAVARLLGGVEHHHVEQLLGGDDVAQPGEQVGLHEAEPYLVEAGVLLRQGQGLLIQIDADDFLGSTQGLGIDREAARVAAQVEDAPAGAEGCQQAAIVALIEEEAGLVLAARGHPEADAMLGDRLWRRGLGRPAVERFLLLHVLLGEPVKSARRVVLLQDGLDDRPEAVHARGEELQHQQRSEAIDDQAAQAVALGMHQAIGVADGVETEPAAAQLDGALQAAAEEGLVDGFLGLAGQHAQGDARMAVIEAAADPVAVAIEDIHDAAGRQPCSRFLDHFLEDPRMAGAALDFEADLG